MSLRCVWVSAVLDETASLGLILAAILDIVLDAVITVVDAAGIEKVSHTSPLYLLFDLTIPWQQIREVRDDRAYNEAQRFVPPPPLVR
jgi:hypothetical protein